MVKAYSEKHRQALKDYLYVSLLDNWLALAGDLDLASSPYDPNRVFCVMIPESSNDSGTYFPRCLLETAIDDFCMVSKDTRMNNSSPFTTGNKGGRWKTYKFTGYSISGLYVGVEFNRLAECDGHWRGIYSYNNIPDRSCRDKLLGEVVDSRMSPQYSVSSTS
jgi:hypothetical protein